MPATSTACRSPARWRSPTSTRSPSRRSSTCSRLGRALDFDRNTHLQEAYEAALLGEPASGGDAEEQLPDPAAAVLARERARDRRHPGRHRLSRRLGAAHARRRPRAAGPRVRRARAAHPGRQRRPGLRGDDPAIAITRSDAIIKAPSNDPLTAVAIARTLADVAPDHPLTKHLAVGYWKGGDTAVEEQLYRPENIEKIVAWGGLASVKHVTRYIQPGLEMIALDPKRSATIIGHQAFDDDETMREVAARAAVDIGVANQEGCANARVIYVLSGTDAGASPTPTGSAS